MKLFAKGKAEKGGQPQAPVFSPIDRIGLLGLLDQVVNGSQTGVLELHEARGTWVYAFQAGALTHASGGRVRGARQAFDLLWEFQSGECLFAPGPNPSLAGNLYIDKGRLLDLLRRSQVALQGPSTPYIAPDQQRPVAPVNRPYTPQMPAWQPGAPTAPQGWPPTGQPGQPGMPAAHTWGAGGFQQQQPSYPQPQPGQQQSPPSYQQPPPGYQPPPPGYQPQQPGYPGAPYPGAPYPGGPQQGQPYPSQGYPQAPAGSPQPGYPAYPQPPMPQQAMPQQAMPVQPPQAAQPPAAPPAPVRPVTPPSFSVPPMAIPRKRESLPTYQPPAAAPTPPTPEPAKAAPPKDDLAALRASLVAQAPPVTQAPAGPAWGVRTAEGTVAAPKAPDRKATGKGKDKSAKAKGAKAKKDSKLMASVKVQLIKFLLWACERKYSPDDRWTLKDAFEISTMELRDQFIGAFSESFKASKKAQMDDDTDDMAAGRMRGRGRKH